MFNRLTHRLWIELAVARSWTAHTAGPSADFGPLRLGGVALRAKHRFSVSPTQTPDGRRPHFCTARGSRRRPALTTPLTCPDPWRGHPRSRARYPPEPPLRDGHTTSAALGPHLAACARRPPTPHNARRSGGHATSAPSAADLTASPATRHADPAGVHAGSGYPDGDGRAGSLVPTADRRALRR